MNTNEILDLADYMEALSPEKYDQAFWFHGCNTPSCIAGHCVSRKGWKKIGIGVVKKGEKIGSVNKTAGDILGLEKELADRLFTSLPYIEGTPTPLDAAATLRHLAETGEVDWMAARTQR